MKTLFIVLLGLLATLSVASVALAQQAHVQRLPTELFDVTPPSERVLGTPGQMSVRPLACRTMPTAQTRRRIVDVALQEWGFFGFPIVDQTDYDDDFQFELVLNGSGNSLLAFDRMRGGGPPPGLPHEEAIRVGATVAGYWATTPSGVAMIARQDQAWNQPQRVRMRWADPWSAAFISWVMCEAGLGDASQFQRAIAHWTYIDQAIRARDGSAPQAAFVAYELGEAPIAPGDLLCSGRRPAYRSIAQRRRQLGVGARTHCDIVVKLDVGSERIFTVGGNVRRSVSLKLMPAARGSGGSLRPAEVSEAQGIRALFAHLKLRAEPIEDNALDGSPTMKALDCVLNFEERHMAYGLRPTESAGDFC